MKKSYVALSADVLHPGHYNIINKARELGEVVVGVLTDKAISEYKRLPYLSQDQRKNIAENIKGVNKVVFQDTLDYTENLLDIKPDYVVHGDNWKHGVQKKVREKVIEVLKQWNGQLIEIPYTKDISFSKLRNGMNEVIKSPEIRGGMLRRLLNAKKIVRILEAHDGLTSLIVENTEVIVDGEKRSFDGMWISSLTDSTSKGKPDIELVDVTSRLQTINEVLEVSSKPIILDGDTGGILEHFIYTVKTMERLGISAIIIEDKVGLKKNSLFGTDVKQTQDTIENFCKKIRAGKKAQLKKDFMIIARIESLILKQGVLDALKRAKAYIDAGVDGIMIHSKDKSTKDLFHFCDEYAKFDYKVPLVAVPSAYSHVTEEKLYEKGVNIVIYANHLLRSAYPAMVKVSKTILENKRALEVEELCMPIKDILNLIPGTK